MIDTWVKVEKIIHKAFIQVDRNGTKAAAATVASGCAGGIGPIIEKEVMLDRPFLYAIIHNETGLPIFVGAVNYLEDSDDNSKKHCFKTDEERYLAAKTIYRSIAYKVHPDFNPLYESEEELQELFKEAKLAYRRNDAYKLERIERDLMIMLKELWLDPDELEAKYKRKR